MQHDALPGSGEALGAPTVERFAGVFVVDHQIVMSLGSLLDHLTHRQQGAPGGDRATDGDEGFAGRVGHEVQVEVIPAQRFTPIQAAVHRRGRSGGDSVG